MYLHSNITGLCLEQFYFSSAKPGMFRAGGWCTATLPECWNSPQELFLQEQKAGSGSTVDLEPKAGASCIFQASHAHNYSPVVVRKEGLLAKWPRGDGLSVSSQKQLPASHGHGSRQTDCSRAHISSSTCVKTHLLSISQQLLCFETHYNRIKKQSRLLNGLVILFVRRTSWQSRKFLPI